MPSARGVGQRCSLPAWQYQHLPADPGIDHRLVADLRAFGVRAQRHDFANDLMAHGARRIHGLLGRHLVAAAHVEIAFPQMDVAVADAGGGDTHQHFGTLRRRIGFLDLL